MDFASLLSPEQKRNLLENRIQQFASEAYQYSLNLKTAQDVGTEEQVDGIKKSIDILESAIRVHQEELQALPAPITE